MGLFEKLKNGLKNTKDALASKITGVINSFTKIDEDFFEELEETLILSDIGAVTSANICEALRKEVKATGTTDPAAVVFDAVKAGIARDADVIICDTAGRLHNKKNLMDELKKIARIVNNNAPDSRVETLLVLDATTGQNAVNQARLFKETADITGIVLTKLDGTAKGGIIIPIKEELGIPVKLVGVGEKIDDLQPFVPRDYVEALFE